MPFEKQSTSESETIALMKERLSKFETEEGRLKGLSYIPKSPDEVVITTTPKAGTTWLQQVCHQIRSASRGGDGLGLEFSEISEVVPWLELASDQGQDLDAPQYGDAEMLPRFFKTHAWEPHCPKFSKVIVVLRNPFDVVKSFYNFFEDWFFEPGTVSMDAFAREFWLARDIPTSKMQNASYFIHLLSWYKRRRDPGVLILFFEDLREDLEAQVRKIARFVSTDKLAQHNFDKPEIIKQVVKRSSFSFMKEHESHFDERLSKLSRNEVCGLPKDAGMSKSKIAEGKVQHGAGLSPNLEEAITQKWKCTVQPETGCATYEDLRKQLNGQQ